MKKNWGVIIDFVFLEPYRRFPSSSIWKLIEIVMISFPYLKAQKLLANGSGSNGKILYIRL